MVDGSIMASHMTVNIAEAKMALPIGIHIIPMVQFPGMGIPPDIERLK